MKRYLLGHYDQSESESRILYKESNRKILRVLRDSYPVGLDSYQIQDKTQLPLKTIYPQVSELLNERFIYEILPERNRGRPEMGSPDHVITGRTRSKFVIEEVAQLYDKYDGKRSAPLPPGSIIFDSAIQQAWMHIVNKEEAEELEWELLNFLEKVLRRVNESDKPQLRDLAPTQAEKFLCLQCGINHEARDFMRAMLLLLLDQFERNVKYLEFLKKNNFLTSIAFDHARSKIVKPEVAKIQTTTYAKRDIKKSIDFLRLRIISIGSTNERGYTSCLAVNQEGGFIPIAIYQPLIKDGISPDTMIECIPSSILDHYVFISNDGLNLRVIEDDKAYPKLSDIERMKIKDLNPGYKDIRGIVDAIVVEVPNPEDPHRDMEEFNPRSRLLVADDSGTAELVYRGYWESQIDYVRRYRDPYSEVVADNSKTPFSLGDQIQVIGATASLDEALKPTLVLQPYSSFTREQVPARTKVTLRILSIEKDAGRNQLQFVAINIFQEFFFGTIAIYYKEITDKITIDTVILCITDKIPEKSGEHGYIIRLYDGEDYIQVIYDGPAIPKLSQLVSKIVDIQKGSLYRFYVTEGVILQTPSVEVYTDDKGRDSLIFRTIIGDETGKISLEERNSAYLQNMKSGDKVRVVGSYAYEEEGETKLGISGYGSIIKI